MGTGKLLAFQRLSLRSKTSIDVSLFDLAFDNELDILFLHRFSPRFLLWRFLSASYDPLNKRQGSCRPYLETSQVLYLTSRHMRHFLRRRSCDAEPMGGGRFA